MIVAVVTFDLPPSTRRAEALALYKGSAPRWAGNPDLAEKTYFFDAEKALGGGVYHWHSSEAAQRWLGEDYRCLIRARYGSVPRIDRFEAVLHVDTATGAIVEP